MKSMLSAGLAGVAMAAGPKWTELTAEYSYERWLADFAPRYPGTPEAFRENLGQILVHNADDSLGWKAGVNQFTGLVRGAAVRVPALLGPRHPAVTAVTDRPPPPPFRRRAPSLAASPAATTRA